MTLSHDEAESALRAVAEAEARSLRAYGYQQASPHLLLWGCLWILGYGMTEFWPHQWTAIWSAVVAVGLVASFGLGMRKKPPKEFYSRFAAIALTAFAFIFAVIAIMAPRSGNQIGALIPLTVAVGYALLGIWRGPRFYISAAVIAALTLGGYFFLPDHFNLWMAALGGGSLVLVGFWLSKV